MDNKINTALLQPASGGFEMYQRGDVMVEDYEDLSDYISDLAADGWEIEEAPEISGKIYDQNGGVPYRIRKDSEEWCYQLIYIPSKNY